MNEIQILMLDVWNRHETKFIFGHVLLNFFIAIARSFSDGTFNLRKMGAFVYEKLIPYVGVFAISLEFGEAIGLPGISTVVWGLIQTSLLAQTVHNLSIIGISLPDSVTRLVTDRVIEFDEGELKKYRKETMDAYDEEVRQRSEVVGD